LGNQLVISHFWKLDNSGVIAWQNVKVALAVPVLQCKNLAVEGKWSLSSSFLSSGLAQGKSTENLPSHIRRRASCARGEMHPAFLGIMAGRIFLWVQAQDIRRKDDDNDQK